MIAQEIAAIREMDFYKNNKLLQLFEDSYEQVEEGGRDLYV